MSSKSPHLNNNLKFYGKEYYEYTELLSLGQVYYILISKRLLLKPIIPLWAYIFGLFLVPNNIFFFMVGFPSIIIFPVFLAMLFPLWEACNISSKAYIAFHSTCIITLKIVSIPVSMFLEVLWTLCF